MHRSAMTRTARRSGGGTTGLPEASDRLDDPRLTRRPGTAVISRPPRTPRRTSAPSPMPRPATAPRAGGEDVVHALCGGQRVAGPGTVAGGHEAQGRGVAPATATARYELASELLRLGGEGYDAMALPDGATCVVVGDVTGRDVEAAPLMGLISNMVRAIALDRDGPPDLIMSRLDHTLTFADPPTATLVLGRIERGRGEGRRGVCRRCWSAPTAARATWHPPVTGSPWASTRPSPGSATNTPSRPPAPCCCSPMGWSSAAARTSTWTGRPGRAGRPPGQAEGFAVLPGGRTAGAGRTGLCGWSRGCARTTRRAARTRSRAVPWAARSLEARAVFVPCDDEQRYALIGVAQGGVKEAGLLLVGQVAGEAVLGAGAGRLRSRMSANVPRIITVRRRRSPVPGSRSATDQLARDEVTVTAGVPRDGHRLLVSHSARTAAWLWSTSLVAVSSMSLSCAARSRRCSAASRCPASRSSAR